jgi:hypothetical protein
MRFNNTFKATLIKSGLAASVLLLASGAANAQVALTAQPSTTTLPDGQTVPMWGLACGTVTASSGAPTAGAPTCASLNPSAGATAWSPPVITVQTGTPLQITLTNSLPVPTSLVIVGQLGGGLGSGGTTVASPAHAGQTTTTWPTAGTATVPFTPPAQGKRVQSFATEVAAGTTSSTLTWSSLNPGTYLLESGTHPSIQGPMGLYGIVVVTTSPSASTPGMAYPTVSYDSDVPLLLSEIDPLQNSLVSQAVATSGFSETAVWSGQPGGCGNPKSSTYLTCYPPAVNYDPRYYLINGVSFDRTKLTASSVTAVPAAAAATAAAPAVPATTATAAGVLLRFVNAGLRMHVPSVVGASMALIAEDGNVLPGTPKVQNEVFLAAGKTYDAIIHPATTPVLSTTVTTATYNAATYPVYDRQLSLSTNNQRDGGMQAYLQVNGGAVSGVGSANNASAVLAVADSYWLVPGNNVVVNDPAKGVIANDKGIYGVAVQAGAGPTGGTVTLNPNGTFTYVPNTGTSSDAFTYCGNGAATGAACAQVKLQACTGTCLGAAPTANPDIYFSNVASQFQIGAPGVLANDKDQQGHPLTASGLANISGGIVTLNPDGSFTAIPTCAINAPIAGTGCAGNTAPPPVTFQYTAVNSQNMTSAPASVTVNFSSGSGLQVNVYDAPSTLPVLDPTKAVKITDYRWIIEEDRTFNINPAQANAGACTSPGVPAGCGSTPSLGANFHTSHMPVVAAGCVGTWACESGQTVLGQPAVCDVGDGICRTTAAQQTPVDPSQVHLDPNKRYYISILPGDAGNSFTSASGAPVSFACTTSSTGTCTRQFSIQQDCGTYSPTAAKWAAGSGTCGHSMGGAPVAAAASSVNVVLQETPFQPSKISVFVFEDDYPLNGENDAGGGVDVLAPLEPGLGGFEVRLWDDAGGPGDATGQLTHDMFNMPLSNSLAGTIDPTTGFDACPISPTSTDGIVGRIVTCPTYENGTDGAGNKVLSPLAGQAVIANMMPGRYGVQADPGADRIGKGEEWLQTNTLDGQKAHDSFIKVGGPAYFQEFGPAGFHVVIGFANPAIINGRLGKPGDGKGLECSGLPTTDCKNTVQGTVTMERQSRSPDQRLYSSGNNSALSFTQCYVSLGDPDGMDIAFTKCDATGHFALNNIPNGTWRITIFDQWNDQIVDGLTTPVPLLTGQGYDFGQIPRQQWHTDVATSTFLDLNQNGVRDANEPGLLLASTINRYRDGSLSNLNNTDLNGHANFNEIFPLFNWYVLDDDSTRFKQTGVHVVYDAGGPADGTPGGGTSTIAAYLANTIEKNSVPKALRVPGAVYCGNADCADIPDGIKAGPGASSDTPSTGRIDPPWATTEAWQGFIGSYEFLEFGKTPFIAGENGGIRGEVIYASTRPFDDPALLIHTSWTPDVAGVTVNLYQEGTAADGTQTLTLVDTTTTTSWDDWAQGFHLGADGVTQIPNMNCPGQGDATQDLYFYTLKDTPQALNPGTPLPNHSQYKCYDGLHNFNQVQPAPFDGMYKFPSVTAMEPTTGKPTRTNCTICMPNPSGDGTKMLPAGTYVVEVIVPPGYELVKEEDKNILIGDNYIAPVTQQFAGIGNIFILPDQASVNAQYNENNVQNPTNNLGTLVLPIHEGDTGSVESKWPCVGALRTVPDYISLFPYSKEVAPFAGASRHLCDRKEVALVDQTSVLAKFWLFSSTHIAAHFTGFILDDLSSEFDPFSPQFGEKFAVPNLPVSIKDFTGNEVMRTYTDQWGVYNGLNYSTWEVNPPNPTGYAPTMMVACMNDPGTGATPDPFFNPSYSQFCYEIPYMPGQTQYMDTPVIPTAAFAEGYNAPDCNYPDATPAVATVVGDPVGTGGGPWVSTSGHTLTITALGDAQVNNPSYSGPQATSAPYNQKFLTRHYGFGGTPGKVTIGGVNAPVTAGNWGDKTITVAVPDGVPSCSVNNSPLQKKGAAPATGSWPTYNERCGELVITTAGGKQSIDAATITVGGKTPTYVVGENAAGNALQLAIDAAAPGDLILVGPGTYTEMLLMWKPLRLQGVGAGSVTINANTHPSGRMDPWRRQVNCLFGLALNGSLLASGNQYDPTGVYSSLCPALDSTNPLSMRSKVDPLPLEGIIGWDTTLNGNLAQLLQEPSLMGAYEGAAITVLGKGENMSIDGNPTTEGDFPANSRQLTGSKADCAAFPSNFMCNPSRIDGLTLTNSSQGGGGIYVHAWNHYLEIANNRIHGNAGTLSGGINIGQGESPDAILNAAGVQQPFLFDRNVRVHNNSITANSSYGDELFSASPSAAGGVTFCTGADYYHFNYNWVCGNLSTGDGGGLVHVGFIYNGDISHNWILFNQSNNITLPTNGGGIAVLGAAPDGMTVATPGNPSVECGNTITDADCAPGLSDGIGPGLVIDSNLIMGNTAESGSGGGIRLQTVNGTEVTRFPNTPSQWYEVDITNNIIANNVAGWDGGGISLQDALKVDIVNNTIVSNDTTASSGVLFNTPGAPGASTPPPGCDPSVNPTCAGSEVTTSTIQAAGLVTMQNTANMTSSMPATVTCPAGHYSGASATNAQCRTFSYPRIVNDLFWQNRVFNIQVGNIGTGLLSQQNLVTLVPQLSQAMTGQCAGGASYWDIGVRGDTGPNSHQASGTLPANYFTLNPTYSILTDVTSYGATAAHNSSNNPNVASQYCNGSRVPPENGGMGYAVPPGIADATLPNPVFNLTPAATVDEGNNWINMTYGPLVLPNPTLLPEQSLPAPLAPSAASYGDYGLTGTSAPAIGHANLAAAPPLDFFGTPRSNHADIGAVEYAGTLGAIVNVTGGPLAFGNVTTGRTSAAQSVTLHNTGGSAFTGITVATNTPSTGFARTTGSANCGTTLAAGANCNIYVVFSPTATGTVAGTLTITGNVAASGSPVSLSGTGVAPIVAAAWIPPTWSPSQARNCPGSTSAQRAACAADPMQLFMLTNTGNVTITGVGAASLAGASPGDYTIIFSTCGPGFFGTTTLTAGSSCFALVQFRPRTADAANSVRNATLSVTDSAGTQVATLSGMAN